jgi:hypothetical protein
MADEFDPTIRVLAFFLADHADAIGGKVYTNGAFWNRLHSPSYPSTHHFAVAAVLEVPWRAERQTHTFAVRFDDADGGAMGARIDGQFQVDPNPALPDGEPTLIPLATQVHGFVVAAPGAYVAVLEVDGIEVARWSFHAVSIAQSPT